LSFSFSTIFAGRKAEAIVSDAESGATRIASAFSLACTLFAIRRALTPPAPRRRGAYQMLVFEEFDPSEDRFIRGIIKKKVGQLIGQAGFTPQDRESLEQELFRRVLQSLARFNPDVGHRNKYVTAVVERFVANVLRDKKAGKRDHRRITSLNVTIEVAEEGPTELVQTIGDRELDARLCREKRSAEELSDLAMDLASIIQTLPPQWRKLIELRTSMTMPEIAREMGVPRTTLNEWMKRIRVRFEEAGLRDYLES
jgi:RNA polymerase sigma factor (sigma-70 family)